MLFLYTYGKHDFHLCFWLTSLITKVHYFVCETVVHCRPHCLKHFAAGLSSEPLRGRFVALKFKNDGRLLNEATPPSFSVTKLSFAHISTNNDYIKKYHLTKNVSHTILHKKCCMRIFCKCWFWGPIGHVHFAIMSMENMNMGFLENIL